MMMSRQTKVFTILGVLLSCKHGYIQRYSWTTTSLNATILNKNTGFMLALPWRKNDTLVVNGQPLVLMEEGPEGASAEWDSTGTIFWDASVVLFEYIQANVDLEKEDLVVELGCGVGALSIAVAKMKAHRVVGTDVEELQLTVEKNIRLNDVTNCTFKALYWGKDEWPSEEGSPSLVLASDFLYKEALIVPFVESLKPMLTPTNRALLCLKIRSTILNEKFATVVYESSLKMNEVKVSDGHVIWEVKWTDK